MVSSEEASENIEDVRDGGRESGMLKESVNVGLEDGGVLLRGGVVGRCLGIAWVAIVFVSKVALNSKCRR